MSLFGPRCYGQSREAAAVSAVSTSLRQPCEEPRPDRAERGLGPHGSRARLHGLRHALWRAGAGPVPLFSYLEIPGVKSEGWGIVTGMEDSPLPRRSGGPLPSAVPRSSAGGCRRRSITPRNSLLRSSSALPLSSASAPVCVPLMASRCVPPPSL